MFDVYKYEENRAFELNTSVQSGILYYLDRLWTDMNNTRFKNPVRYQRLVNEYQGIQSFLEFMDIYAVIGWAGHRKNHFFPNIYDAEAERDWIEQCREDGYDD